MEKKYFTCAEVAQIYGVKVSTVWSWIRNGKLGCITISNRYRIREQDLNKFDLDSNNND